MVIDGQSLVSPDSTNQMPAPVAYALASHSRPGLDVYSSVHIFHIYLDGVPNYLVFFLPLKRKYSKSFVCFRTESSFRLLPQKHVLYFDELSIFLKAQLSLHLRLCCPSRIDIFF